MLIPEHYIMRRWPKEGNKGMVSDGDSVQIKTDYKESQTARYEDLSRVAFNVVSNESSSERLWEFTKNILMECNEKVERKILEYEQEATCSNQGSNIKDVMPSQSSTLWTNPNIFILEPQCARTKGQATTARKKTPWEEKTSTMQYYVCQNVGHDRHTCPTFKTLGFDMEIPTMEPEAEQNNM
ncbi:hypothetical protein AMTR_s00103p00073500 [Amborella trichopoda]|uniref:Protein FAR1-RELATED SEQUENCE n=1 Tax=Amborella trichopoda TaxID=13333 RepID=W1NYW2_AMBTC|nr:hypothetical protein AMTR_s00103p00073500 [Amborella trichopoda]